MLLHNDIINIRLLLYHVSNLMDSSAQSTAHQADRMLSSLAVSRNEDTNSDKQQSSSSSSKKSSGLTKRSDIFGESDATVAAELDEAKVQAAMKRLAKMEAEGGGGDLEEIGAAVRVSKSGGSKRSYNSMSTVDVTAEDMEAYRRIKSKREDPMAAFMGDEEILLDYNPS